MLVDDDGARVFLKGISIPVFTGEGNGYGDGQARTSPARNSRARSSGFFSGNCHLGAIIDERALELNVKRKVLILLTPVANSSYNAYFWVGGQFTRRPRPVLRGASDEEFLRR